MDMGKQWHPRMLHPDFKEDYRGNTVGWVKPHILLPYQGNEVDPEHVERLTHELRNGRGLREVLHLGYSPDHNWASLGEGNHRMHAAIAAGLSHVPVVGYRSSYMTPQDRGARAHPQPSIGELWNNGKPEMHEGIRYPKSIAEGGYFKGDFNPKHILPAGSVTE
jgi:hypothetical protein